MLATLPELFAFREMSLDALNVEGQLFTTHAARGDAPGLEVIIRLMQSQIIALVRALLRELRLVEIVARHALRELRQRIERRIAALVFDGRPIAQGIIKAPSDNVNHLGCIWHSFHGSHVSSWSAREAV